MIAELFPLATVCAALAAAATIAAVSNRRSVSRVRVSARGRVPGDRQDD